MLIGCLLLTLRISGELRRRLIHSVHIRDSSQLISQFLYSLCHCSTKRIVFYFCGYANDDMTHPLSIVFIQEVQYIANNIGIYRYIILKTYNYFILYLKNSLYITIKLIISSEWAYKFLNINIESIFNINIESLCTFKNKLRELYLSLSQFPNIRS